ncbi:MAG: glycosyltransferase family 39 protein [Phormidesmis sp.]
MGRISKLMILALLVGSVLRFANLEGKVYWHDEAYTALYATGHDRTDAYEALFDGQLKTAGDILVWQQATPDYGLAQTVRQLAKNDAQHPPLYYLLTRMAMYITGNTVVATRSIAAIAGVLLIPAVYWLSLELFTSRLTASLSAALIAVSPFHYLYAQEAREYSLWTLTTVLASGALLKALRKNTLSTWLVYVAILTTSLYGCILMFLVIGGHGLYVALQAIATYRQKRSLYAFTSLRNFTLSTAASLLLFAPWLRIIPDANVVSWTAQPMPILSLVKIWAGNITRLFFDLNLDSTDPLFYTIPPVLIALALVGYTLIWSIQRMPKPALLFLACIGGVTLLAFVGPDLVIGGRRSSVTRYLIPAYLCIQIAVAYLLSQLLTSRRPSHYSSAVGRSIGRSATAVLLVAGLISCLASIPSDTWWHKKNSHLNPEVARTVNQTPGALLISSDNNANLGEILSLSHSLNPGQPLLLSQEPNVPTIPDGFDSVFLFNTSAKVRDELNQSSAYQVTSVDEPGRLWQIQSK